MNGYDENRRRFLAKLGMTMGVTMTGNLVAGKDNLEAGEMKISAEQQAFMDMYEKWMDEFVEVIKVQKKEPDSLENNMKIVALSEQAKGFQSTLVQYMQDDNFARYYMIATERMTLAI